jgi:hypothetical protein
MVVDDNKPKEPVEERQKIKGTNRCAAFGVKQTTTNY